MIQPRGTKVIERVRSFAWQFEFSFAFDCYDEMLDSGYLGSGRQTNGIVMFEVPKRAKGLRIAYRPSLFDADEVAWRLKRKPDGGRNRR